jgi:hypothetical protein
MLKIRIFLGIPKDSLFSFTKFCSLRKAFFEHLNICTNNKISVKAAKILHMYPSSAMLES